MIRLGKRDFLMSKIAVKIIQIPSALARGLGLSHYHCSQLFYAWKVGLCNIHLLCISFLLMIVCVDNTIISKDNLLKCSIFEYRMKAAAFVLVLIFKKKSVFPNQSCRLVKV